MKKHWIALILVFALFLGAAAAEGAFDLDSLMQEIDRILSELRESGKLRELSLRYFGEDLTNP